MSASKRQRTCLCLFSNVVRSKRKFGNMCYAPFPKTEVRKISAESYRVIINVLLAVSKHKFLLQVTLTLKSLKTSVFL